MPPSYDDATIFLHPHNTGRIGFHRKLREQPFKSKPLPHFETVPYREDMADSTADLGRVFVALADSLKTGHDVVDTMDYLVETATTYTSATEAGIVLADTSGILHVVASTSERLADIEEEQLGTHQGPCWDTFRTGVLVEVPNISDTEGRWPAFAAAAEARGFQAAHAVPLRLRNQLLGSLNLFSPTQGPFTDTDAALAQALADVATIGVIQQNTIQHSHTIAEQLQSALDTRIVIEQAKGFLAERHDLPIDTAFTVLRTYARRTGKRLHDVATQVINNELPL